MSDEIIDIMKKKPEILQDEPREFKVMYEDIDLPNIEPVEEFNFDLFKGKLLSNDLDQVVIDGSVKKKENLLKKKFLFQW